MEFKLIVALESTIQPNRRSICIVPVIVPEVESLEIVSPVGCK